MSKYISANDESEGEKRQSPEQRVFDLLNSYISLLQRAAILRHGWILSNMFHDFVSKYIILQTVGTRECLQLEAQGCISAAAIFSVFEDVKILQVHRVNLSRQTTLMRVQSVLSSLDRINRPRHSPGCNQNRIAKRVSGEK